MGKAIRASLLVLLLACSAQAGYMPNDAPAPPPPSQPANAAQEPPAAATTEDGTQGTFQGGVTRIALDLLALLPSLL
jgi:hypothetical protein